LNLHFDESVKAACTLQLGKNIRAKTMHCHKKIIQAISLNTVVQFWGKTGAGVAHVIRHSGTSDVFSLALLTAQLPVSEEIINASLHCRSCGFLMKIPLFDQAHPHFVTGAIQTYSNCGISKKRLGLTCIKYE